MIKYPDEKDRQANLLKFLEESSDLELVDWNNFNGHIVASSFVYNKKLNKFLALYHNDLKCYLYSGGHVDDSDLEVFQAAEREVIEETGIKALISVGESISIDIDTHVIPFNERLQLAAHYHFDFRYLFIVNTDEVVIDSLIV